MPELDQQTDAQLAAVAALVRAAVQFDLGKSVLQSVFSVPILHSEMGDARLPGLSIYCVRSRFVHGASTRYDQELTVAFDYVLQKTALQLRDPRWHVLRTVWNSMMRALLADQHEALTDSGGSMLTNVLCSAGLQLDTKSLGHADFGFKDTQNTHPHFRAVLAFTHFPEEVDASTLDDFLRLYTSFDAPGGDHESPLVTTEDTDLPGYSGSES